MDKKDGGADRARTGDPVTASHVLSQLSYSPTRYIIIQKTLKSVKMTGWASFIYRAETGSLFFPEILNRAARTAETCLFMIGDFIKIG